MSQENHFLQASELSGMLLLSVLLTIFSDNSSLRREVTYIFLLCKKALGFKVHY